MKFYRLKELCTDIIDCPHSTPKWLDKGIPVIRNYNLNNRGIDTTNLSFVDEETYVQRIKRAKPEAGDIIISREAPMGVVGMIPENFKCCLGQRLVLLKVDKQKCNPKYLLYSLTSQFVQQQIKRIDLTGSIVSNLNIPDLKNLLIPVIEKQQNECAHLLDLIDSKIENNNKINDELESMAKTIYDYWFLQFEFPNEEGNPYRSSEGKMVWNEELKREIPEGWEVIKISKIADLYQPKTISEQQLSTSGKYYVYGANGIVGKYHEFNHKNNEIAVCCRGASCGDYLMTQPMSWITGNSMVITPYDIKNKEFLFYGLSKDRISPYISGSAQPQITRSNLENMVILMPKEKLINNFNDIALLIRKKTQNIFIENQELVSLRNFLLPLLMNGQVGFKE